MVWPPPLKDLIQAYQELRIRLYTQPSRADGLNFLSSYDIEYSEHNAGLQAQQVVGPLISTFRCWWNLNHWVTSSSWNHNMNSKFQLWSCCLFVLSSWESMMYWKTDNEQTILSCPRMVVSWVFMSTNSVCIRAYVAYCKLYKHSVISCMIILEAALCDAVLHYTICVPASLPKQHNILHPPKWMAEPPPI